MRRVREAPRFVAPILVAQHLQGITLGAWNRPSLVGVFLTTILMDSMVFFMSVLVFNMELKTFVLQMRYSIPNMI